MPELERWRPGASWPPMPRLHVVRPTGPLPPGAATFAAIPEDELSNNIINSLYSCVEGENRQAQIREQFIENTTPVPPASELTAWPQPTDT